ncbi:uncharacterized protein LOC128889240 isoform X2 [Hylaeus anthracinus]|nr:uncharacterized protein LOC128889240 isoform X2 [Hylaeus anthracinus]
MASLKNVKICDVHFEDFYKLNIRLSTSAVPTLHLPKSVTVEASISAVIPEGITEVIEATDAIESVTSQTHSDGHSSTTPEAKETIGVPSTSGVSQKKKFAIRGQETYVP